MTRAEIQQVKQRFGIIGNTEAFLQQMRLDIRPNLYMFIGKSCFKWSQYTAAPGCIILNPLQAFFRGGVKGWHKQHIVPIQLLFICTHKITFDVHFIQSIINPSYHIIIVDSIPAVCREGEPFQG